MTTVDAILEQYGMPAGGIADYVMTDAEIDALNRRRAYDKGIMLAYPREGVDQEFIFGGIGKSISKVAKGIKSAFKAVAPVALPIAMGYAFGPAGIGLSSMQAGALSGGIGSLMQGGDLKDALRGAAMGAATGKLIEGISTKPQASNIAQQSANQTVGDTLTRSAGPVTITPEMSQSAAQMSQPAAQTSFLDTLKERAGGFKESVMDVFNQQPDMSFTEALKQLQGDEVFAAATEDQQQRMIADLMNEPSVLRKYGPLAAAGLGIGALTGGFKPPEIEEEEFVTGADLLRQDPDRYGFTVRTPSVMYAQEGGEVEPAFIGALPPQPPPERTEVPSMFTATPLGQGNVSAPFGSAYLNPNIASFATGQLERKPRPPIFFPPIVKEPAPAPEEPDTIDEGQMAPVAPVSGPIGRVPAPNMPFTRQRPPTLMEDADGKYYMRSRSNPFGNLAPEKIYVSRSPEYLFEQEKGYRPDLQINLEEGGGVPSDEVFPRRNGGIGPEEGTPGKDSVRAMLMPGEFVMTTSAVRGMGEGNLNRGITKMYDLMGRLEMRNEGKVA
jgi:hypothetical protein